MWLCEEDDFNLWDSENDTFGECFEDTILVAALPLIALVIAAVVQYNRPVPQGVAHRAKASRPRPSRKSKGGKGGLQAPLLANELIAPVSGGGFADYSDDDDFGDEFGDEGEWKSEQRRAGIVTRAAVLSGVVALAHLLATVLPLLGVDAQDRGYRDVTNGVLTLGWALSACTLLNRQRYSHVAVAWWAATIFTGAIKLWSVMSRGIDGSYECVSFLATYGLGAATVMIVWCGQVPAERAMQGDGFGDEEAHKVFQQSAEMQASLFSRLVFSWMDSLLKTGNKRPLEFGDLPEHHPSDHASEVSRRFEESLRTELKGDNPKVSRAFRKTFGAFFVSAIPFKFVHDILLFVGPEILNRLIDFLKSDDDMSLGYTYVFVLFGASIVQTLVLHQYFHIAYRTGIKVRAATTTAVYNKAMRLSPSARQERSAGEIQNLMSVDAKRFQDLTPYFHMMWSAPLQIGLSLYFLAQQIGASVLAGLGMMLLMIPLNIYLAMILKKIQKKLMVQKDERVKFTSEVVSSMSAIKSYAWEMTFGEQISDTRDKELKLLRKYALMNLLQTSIWYSGPTFIAMAAFTAYSLAGNILDASTAFTTLALFNILRFPVGMLPRMVNGIVEAQVSVNRFQDFLLSAEIANSNSNQNNNDNGENGGGDGAAVHVEDATFFWDDAHTTPAVSNVRLSVPKQALHFVVGETGCGKSALLSALIGDLPHTGSFRLTGRVAYTAQIAWIQNATIKDNILFGAPYDEARYRRCLYACALLPDLKQLPAGDQTEIGERGINLSGGQKQRVGLCRALYADADVYLLDDPLSAVDSHVARHIMQHCVLGMLKHKTVVLVTHAVSLFPLADHIVYLDHGHVKAQGSYAELQEQGLDLAALEEQAQRARKQSEGRGDDDDGQAKGNKGEDAVDASPLAPEDVEALNAIKNSPEQLRDHGLDAEEEAAVRGLEDMALDAKAGEDARKANEEKGVLVKDEQRAFGQVSWAIYKEWLSMSGGVPVVLATALCFCASVAANLGTNRWLAEWSSAADRQDEEDIPSTEFYLAIYSLLGLAFVGFTSLATLAVILGGLRASKGLHSSLLHTMLRAPMSFFDTTPIGRILNRFTKDQFVADESLPVTMASYLRQVFAIVGVIIIISLVTPYFAGVLIPLGYVYYAIQKYYINSSRELQRLDSVLRSPIYSHFAESLDGVTTIRAFDAVGRFVVLNQEKLDANMKAYYTNIASNRWLAIRLEMLGTALVGAASIFAVLGRGSLAPELGGLSVSYALSITGTLNWMVRMASQRETDIVSVERILDYISTTPEEAPLVIPDRRPPSKAWPSEGRITLKDYQLRYRPELDLVLRGLTCDIEPQQKVGIVGRTGAGKSSLLRALLRLVEPANGSIVIDGVDVSRIGLQDLRSRISIIPQDPVCFAGTVRFNLDPFHAHSDEELWLALERAHLAPHLRGNDQTLDYELTEGGLNLSMGQRQLLCLARALLRQTSILLLDEATSAVDMKTDQLIQQTIRDHFSQCTVLVIAHRLDTVMKGDRVLVLDAGRIVEDGSPQQLLDNPHGAFTEMVAANEKDME